MSSISTLKSINFEDETIVTFAMTDHVNVHGQREVTSITISSIHDMGIDEVMDMCDTAEAQLFNDHNIKVYIPLSKYDRTCNHQVVTHIISE